MNSYVERVLENVRCKDPNQKEFIQAVTEVLTSIVPLLNEHPEYEANGILERIVEPDRSVSFRVTWMDDNHRVCVNRGYRVQFNSSIGPYKGGIRFHPSVNLSLIKFLGFEQIFKNGLTGLPMGGGKGGADFDPKGKSDWEVMRFCHAFMTELQRHIGQFTDVPAGDVGVGAREIGYLFGQYKRIRNEFTGIITGKDPSYGGSLARPEATGYGLCYLIRELLKEDNNHFQGKTVTLSGSGNVAYYAGMKAQELGAKVVTMSDSCGWIYDPDGIDLSLINDIKGVRRGRISEYVNCKPQAEYHTESNVWSVPCEIAMPCATQNEINLQDAQNLVSNGCTIVGEGANMPTTIEATDYLIKHGVHLAPAKAANAGGVGVSGLEMTQNSIRLRWSFQEANDRLDQIMTAIYSDISTAAKAYGQPNNLVLGANIVGFKKVADAMMAQGVQ